MTKRKTLSAAPVGAGNGEAVETAPPQATSPSPVAPRNGDGLFSQVRKGKHRRPRRIFLYGQEGIGKSTFGAMAPRPLFVPVEEGIDDIDCESLPPVRSYSEFMQSLRAVYSEGHRYQTLVVDTLDFLERLIWRDVCEANGKDDIAEFPYANGYKLAIGYWSKILEGLNAIRDKRGMTILLIAHAAIERFEAPDSDSYDRYVPQLHKSAARLAFQWCDEVLFAYYESFTRVSKEKFNEERVRAIGTGERLVRTTEKPFAMAKNRLGLPEELPLDWRVFAKYLNGSNGGEA